jgi:hypothetical protein
LANGHPQIDVTPGAVKRLRTWLRSRCVDGTAEGFIAGLLCGGEPRVTDTVLDDAMARVDQLIALHGHRWFVVLRLRGEATERGVLPVEPRLN